MCLLPRLLSDSSESWVAPAAQLHPCSLKKKLFVWTSTDSNTNCIFVGDRAKLQRYMIFGCISGVYIVLCKNSLECAWLQVLKNFITWRSPFRDYQSWADLCNSPEAESLGTKWSLGLRELWPFSFFKLITWVTHRSEFQLKINK